MAYFVASLIELSLTHSKMSLQSVSMLKNMNNFLYVFMIIF